MTGCTTSDVAPLFRRRDMPCEQRSTAGFAWQRNTPHNNERISNKRLAVLHHGWADDYSAVGMRILIVRNETAFPWS